MIQWTQDYWYIIVGVIIVLLVLVAFAVVPSLDFTPDEEDLGKCKTDSDCAIVQTIVCKCDIGLNKKYVEYWNNLQEDDSIVMCYPCPAQTTGVECVDGSCKAIYG